MKAIIKCVYSADLDIETCLPADRFDDGQWIRLLIGRDGGVGEGSFDVLVCAKRWLARKSDRDGMQLGRCGSNSCAAWRRLAGGVRWLP